MLFTRHRLVIVAGWFTLLAAVSATRLLLGWPAFPTGGLALVLLSGLLVIVLLVVFRGPPPKTVAEVLYDAHLTPSPGRTALSRLEKRHRP